MSRRSRTQTTRGKSATRRVCPECGSVEVARVLHGYVTPALQRMIDQGDAIVANREEWEGITEWYCKSCGCDWSGRWRRFKRTGSVNATR
jgi:hypothetical protein